MSNSTATPIANGTLIETMLVGKIVMVRICDSKETKAGIEYEVEYQGGKLCLDFGANWYVDNGYKFVTRPMNIDRAAEWRAKGY